MVNSEENVHVDITAELLHDDKALTFAVIPACSFSFRFFICTFNLLDKRV